MHLELKTPGSESSAAEHERVRIYAEEVVQEMMRERAQISFDDAAVRARAKELVRCVIAIADAVEHDRNTRAWRVPVAFFVGFCFDLVLHLVWP